MKLLKWLKSGRRRRPHEEFAGAGVGRIRSGDKCLAALLEALAKSVVQPCARSISKLYSRDVEV